MEAVSDWYKIIQARGNSQAKMSNIGVKVDDYEYWANAHKDEYILKYNDLQFCMCSDAIIFSSVCLKCYNFKSFFVHCIS